MSTTPTVTGHGFSVELPAAWEGRIYRRPPPTTSFTPKNRAPGGGIAATRAPDGWLGEQTRAVVHLGNFALPAVRGDYGSGAVEQMTAQNTFIALLEFGPECLGTALYGSVGLPRVSATRFDPNGLQRRLPGQAGCQYFFTEQGRPICLYVVVGSHQQVGPLSEQVNRVLDRIKVEAP